MYLKTSQWHYSVWLIKAVNIPACSVNYRLDCRLKHYGFNPITQTSHCPFSSLAVSDNAYQCSVVPLFSTPVCLAGDTNISSANDVSKATLWTTLTLLNNF